ncbi:uncharacterized protein LOC123537813 [Mercenaria mercenaria]|uniref:uncharacterized protein LOC123537813 n=1 Tax=Mercenaria mercenaria TaxID=6596 RepID=UPI00234E9D18|nr:uncharacterized protein LOC123537813 [Mercenaria mercenaria]
MAEFDSLSFALLIPFAICFVLVFIVCCFADEIKDICRMPNPLPSSYLAVERARPNRRSSRRQIRQGRPQNEEVRNLILSEEGRSRNVSESSADYNQVTSLLASSNFSIVRQPGASLHQNVMMLPQTTIPARSQTTLQTGSQTVLQTGSQRFRIPSTNCIVSRPEVHGSVAQPGTQRIIIQPLGQFAAQNTSRNNSKNFSRNLAIHASTSSKDIGSCLKRDSNSRECESNTNKSQRADLNRNGSAPQLLNNYLINGSTNTPNALNSHTSNTVSSHTSNSLSSHTSNTLSSDASDTLSSHTTSNTLSSDASNALSFSKQETKSSQSDQSR